MWKPSTQWDACILLVETATVWRRYLNRSQDFGADVLAGIQQGSLIPAADYLDAQRLRRVLAEGIRTCMGASGSAAYSRDADHCA